jgi:hypothetical protein
MNRIIERLTRFTTCIVEGVNIAYAIVYVFFGVFFHAFESPDTSGMHAFGRQRTLGHARNEIRRRSRRKPHVGSAFALTFCGVFLITILCGAANIAMATIWIEPTPLQIASFEHSGTAWKLGVGALIGLLGGKTAR